MIRVDEDVFRELLLKYGIDIKLPTHESFCEYRWGAQ